MADVIIRMMREYSPFTVGLIAACSSLFFLMVFSPWLGGVRATFQSTRLKWLWLRGVVLAVAGFLPFVIFAHLEMSKAYAIIFVGPIVAKIISIFLNRERITLFAWCITLCGFVGVLIVLRPGYMPLGIGAIAALAWAFFFGLGYVMGRTIGEENQTVLSMSLFLNIVMAVVLVIPGILYFEAMPLAHVLLIASIGVLGAMGEMLVSLSYARAPSAYVAPVQYTQIIWGVIWGILFFGEYPDAWTMAGAAVIIGAGLMLVWMTQRTVIKI